MLDYEAVKGWNFEPIVHTYTKRDSMLYALGIGMGSVRFQLWRRDGASFHLRARVDTRAAIFLDNARVELA